MLLLRFLSNDAQTELLEQEQHDTPPYRMVLPQLAHRNHYIYWLVGQLHRTLSVLLNMLVIALFPALNRIFDYEKDLADPQFLFMG